MVRHRSATEWEESEKENGCEGEGKNKPLPPPCDASTLVGFDAARWINGLLARCLTLLLPTLAPRERMREPIRGVYPQCILSVSFQNVL